MRILIVILALMIVCSGLAQNITVDNFKHHKHYFWQINSTLPLDKKNATILLKTEKKGFQFKTAKGSMIEVDEGDEGIVLKVPDKTKYIIINHPDFGEYDWRVPLKYLKKNNYYTADLAINDLTKEFKNPNQWLIFNISPEKSVVTVDSVMHRVNDGYFSIYLPLGKHSYKIESPFYEEEADSIVLKDTESFRKNIFLQPAYSYITVKALDPEVEIYVDEKKEGINEITVGKINEGIHRVSLLKNNQWVKDTLVFVGKAEKKNIIIDRIFKIDSSPSMQLNRHPSPYIFREFTTIPRDPALLVEELKQKRDSVILAQVHLMAEDSLTNILIDREIVGKGEWSGFLPGGFHLVSTWKDDRESISQILQISDSTPKTLLLAVPQSSVGMINVAGDVVGAEIIINGETVGFIPCIIQGVPTENEITLLIKKEGYKQKSISVKTKPNDIIDIFVNMADNNNKK